MKLTDVHLRHAPGVPEGLPTITLGSGLTFVVGPNASGKSTLARTMRLAFWDVSTPPAIGAHVRVQKSNGEVVSTDIVGGKAQTRLQKTEMEVSASELYTLGLADLLRDGSRSDREFAAQLQTELHGGVPVAAIRAEILDGQTHHRKPRRDLSDATEKVRDALNDNRTLLSKEQDAKRLQQERERAEDAVRTVAAIDTLVEVLELHDEQNALRSELATLPKALDQLRDDDVQTKRTRQDRYQSAQRARDAQQDTLQRLTDAYDKIDASWKTLAPESVDAGQRIYDARQKAKEAYEAQQANALLQCERLRAAKQRVFGGPVTEDVDEDTKAELIQAVDAAQTSASTLHAYTEMAQYFDAFDVEALDAAVVEPKVDALREWLRTPAPQTIVNGRWRALIAAVCAFAVTAATIVYVALYDGVVDLWVSTAGVLSVLGAVLSLWLWIQLRQTAAAYAADRTRAQRRATQAGVTLPSWNADVVLNTLRREERTLLKCREADRMRHRQNEVHAKVDEAAANHEAANASLRHIAERIGMSSDILTLEVAEVFHRTEQWLRADRAYIDASAARTTAENTLHQCAQEWHEWIDTHGLSTHVKAVGERAILGVSQRETRNVQYLRTEIRHETKVMTREEQSLQDAAEDLATLKARLGAWFGSESRLETAIEQRARRQTIAQSLALFAPRYQRALDALQKSMTPLREHAILPPNATVEALRSTDGFDTLSLDHIRATRADFEDEASRLSELIEHVTRLHSALDNARKSNTLEDAFAARARAESNSQAQAEHRGLLMLEDMMLQWSVQHAGNDGASKSLDEANAWLTRFTHGRFGLRLNMDGALVGYDTHAGETRALSQLSDATRVQALLAARLVAIRDAEAGGEQLPIILDEVFSTTDPHRFEAIAQALSELVRDGRQIVYMTADPGEYERWVSLQARVALVEPHVQWLAKREADVPHGVAIPEHTPIPPPTTESAAEYAEALGVAAPQMAQRADLWPVLWLLPDTLDAVHAAMDKRLNSGGQALSLAQHVGHTQTWSQAPERASELTDRLARRMRMLRAMQQRWALGVSHPFRWQDVEDSETITDTFHDRVLDLYQSHADDPETFVEAVGDLPRFHSARHEELRAYFESEGILAKKAPATPEVLREHALDAVDTASLDTQDIAWLGALVDAHGAASD